MYAGDKPAHDALVHLHDKHGCRCAAAPYMLRAVSLRFSMMMLQTLTVFVRLSGYTFSKDSSCEESAQGVMPVCIGQMLR